VTHIQKTSQPAILRTTSHCCR